MIFYFDLVKVVGDPVQGLYEYIYKMQPFSSCCYSHWGLSRSFHVNESAVLCGFQRAGFSCRPLGCTEDKGKGWMDGWMNGRIE